MIKRPYTSSLLSPFSCMMIICIINPLLTVYTSTCTCTYMWLHVYTTLMYMYMCTCLCTCSCTCMSMYMYMYVYVYLQLQAVAILLLISICNLSSVLGRQNVLRHIHMFHMENDLPAAFLVQIGQLAYHRRRIPGDQ